MPNPLLDEARARQRHTLRAIPDDLVSGWLPEDGDVAPPPAADRWFVETALRRAADELAPGLEFFFGPVRQLAYAETATAAIQARLGQVLFQPLLASLDLMRRVAIDDLQRLRLDDDELARWVHLVVWADELAGDGYHDPRVG